ncbi:hypothetical protein IW261DRAFT_1422198 [Armillaria novae-zelandiae]|uniref:Uncharacterized protein n=1 Tax=Armillaria novae-zelandiae TaxID=153914 RepID=A0AA39P2F9_9AGAR|nr:hypothetical protein IW261DRAFT_1422198 [Armillaria novae-zelandiae]
MSLISIESHEQQALKRKQLRKSWTGPPKEKNNGEDSAAKKQMCKICPERPRVLEQQKNINIHKLLKDTDMFCSVLLHYFSNKNLQYINKHTYELPFTKANPERREKLCSIIDIPKLNKCLGKEDDITFGDYEVTHPNLFHMITKINPQGLLRIQSKFYKNHFTFFNQQIDKDQDIWTLDEAKWVCIHWNQGGSRHSDN